MERGGGGGWVEPPTIFPKRGSLTGPELREGVAGKEGVRIQIIQTGKFKLRISLLLKDMMGLRMKSCS